MCFPRKVQNWFHYIVLCQSFEDVLSLSEDKTSMPAVRTMPSSHKPFHSLWRCYDFDMCEKVSQRKIHRREINQTQRKIHVGQVYCSYYTVQSYWTKKCQRFVGVSRKIGHGNSNIIILSARSFPSLALSDSLPPVVVTPVVDDGIPTNQPQLPQDNYYVCAGQKVLH